MSAPDAMPIADARKNLSDAVNKVAILRYGITLTRRGKPQAALVPVELWQAAQAVGGAAAAIEILRAHATA